MELKGKLLVCDHCGEIFDSRDNSNYIKDFNNHLRDEHEDYKLDDERQKISESGQITKEVIKKSEHYDFRSADNMEQIKEEIKESKGDNPMSDKKDLAIKMIENESPKHGIRRDKNSIQETSKASSGSVITNQDIKQEEKDETKDSFDLKNLLPSSSGLKKWGGGALAVGALIFAGVTAYKNYGKLREADDSSGKGEKEQSKTGEKEGEKAKAESKKTRNQVQVKDEKGNGKKEHPSSSYRTFDDL